MNGSMPMYERQDLGESDGCDGGDYCVGDGTSHQRPLLFHRHLS